MPIGNQFRKLHPGMLAILAVLFVGLVPQALAQLNVGDNTSINLSGNLGFGYAGGWGDRYGSSHATSFSGNGALTGYYYHPSFISFSAIPYYNRSQNNSLSQTITNSSGINSSASFFTGSRFPGSVFYSYDTTNNGLYGLPGVGALSTDGSSQGYGVTWSVLLPDLPTLTASYSSHTSNSTVIGAVGDFKSSTKDFNLNSDYTMAGFLLNGYYSHQATTSNFPDFLGGVYFDRVGTNTVGASATHKLPMSGSFWSSYSHTNYTDGGASSQTGTTSSNSAGVGASISPWQRLTLVSDFRYFGNLIEFAAQGIVTPGSDSVILLRSNDAKSMVSTNTAYFGIGKGFSVIGNLVHRNQWYDDRNYSDTQYGATINYRYSRPLFGMLQFNFGVVDTANKEGHSSLGYVASASMTRKFGNWDTSVDAAYSQNVQTVLATYSTSNVNFGGYTRRRLSQYSYWHVAGRYSKSLLTQQDGNGNQSGTFSTGIGYRKYTVNGAFSKSHGTAVLSTTGELIPTPIGGLVTNDVMTVNGQSYTISVTAVPVSKLTATGYFSKIKSDTTTLFNLVNSNNNGERFSGRLEYRLRKLSFIADYSRTSQLITASNPTGAVVNSYSFTISRWFNVF